MTPALLCAALLLALPWSPWTGIAASPDPAGPFRDTPTYLLSAAGFAVVGAWLWTRDRWLGAAVIYAAALAVLAPNPVALPTVHAFTLGAGALVLLMALPARATSYLRWSVLVSASLQVVVMGWQAWIGLIGPVSGFDISGTLGNPRYAGVALALVMSLAPWWLLPWLGVGVALSQSFLALTVAVVGLVCRWPKWTPAFAVLGAAGWLAVMEVRGGVASTLASRVEVWTLGLWDMLGAPWLGWGPGAWIVRTPAHMPGELWLHAHNEPLQWVYETGAAGAVLLGGWLWAHRRAWAGLLPVFVASLGVQVFHWPTLAAYALVVVGLALREEGRCQPSQRHSAA